MQLTGTLAQPGSAPQRRSRAMLWGRALPHLGIAGSCPAIASVQIRQVPAQLRSIP
jgi:hypothetical protein